MVRLLTILLFCLHGICAAQQASMHGGVAVIAVAADGIGARRPGFDVVGRSGRGECGAAGCSGGNDGKLASHTRYGTGGWPSSPAWRWHLPPLV